MIPQTLTTLAEWAGGVLVQGPPHTAITHVGTDTRGLVPGSLFVALVGERFDAHDFAGQAAQAGAAAVLVSKPVSVPETCAVIRVPDTLAALQMMAATYRREWGGLVLGLTGSNGKTSTKDLTSAVLSRTFKVCATRGNLNNHIGLPLTVLSADAGDMLGVFELGMNHPGEIGPLADIAGPDAAIITNIGTAHLEYMGTQEAIALEKGMLAEAVHPDGCVILNANDRFSPSLARRCQATVLTAGVGQGDIRVENVESSAAGCAFTLHLPDGTSGPVLLPVPGRHMAGNAALAAAAGWHFGLRLEDITDGLQSAVLTKGRLQMRKAAGLTFIDDTYNANPDSMRAALDTLLSFACEGRRIAVLGRMGEIGPTAPAEHLALGAAANREGIDFLCVVGGGDAGLISRGFLESGADPAGHAAFASQTECAAWLRASATPADLILVKGSRSAAMEKVIESAAA
ncbi:MAG: UDP-N-acetylmuramoylalanyl-D-glutamyl-2,6-diaminopimelate/D-alanyl-D-alanyl ligase [Verrucomicrobiales bacterium]|nr:UDP-N-acetylmuramoylalanyl-D-glutamyl-2,6-diaminopimelate/D-alanyl-D-alanyl ligase [Verrucomicrobiales bacterium]